MYSLPVERFLRGHPEDLTSLRTSHRMWVRDKPYAHRPFAPLKIGLLSDTATRQDAAKPAPLKVDFGNAFVNPMHADPMFTNPMFTISAVCSFLRLP